MEIEKYSHVMHISSTVKGKKSNNISMVDVLKSGLPAGTLSGAPKIRAMQIISELETVSRDFYAGTVGYISSGILQTCIVLRSSLIKNGMLYTQVGAGVVYDSIPEKEYEECVQKIAATVKASS
jgi:anthranilate synthase component 1